MKESDGASRPVHPEPSSSLRSPVVPAGAPVYCVAPLGACGTWGNVNDGKGAPGTGPGPSWDGS